MWEIWKYSNDLNPSKCCVLWRSNISCLVCSSKTSHDVTVISCLVRWKGIWKWEHRLAPTHDHTLPEMTHIACSVTLLGSCMFWLTFIVYLRPARRYVQIGQGRFPPNFCSPFIIIFPFHFKLHNISTCNSVVKLPTYCQLMTESYFHAQSVNFLLFN